MSNDHLTEADRGRRSGPGVQRELTAEVADPAVDALCAAPDTDPEDRVDLGRRCVDVLSAQPSHRQIHTGQGHLTKSLLPRRHGLERLHRFVGPGFGVAEVLRARQPQVRAAGVEQLLLDGEGHHPAGQLVAFDELVSQAVGSAQP
ncbi:hypothetical protein [Streptomyces sp. NPDC089919]|uniref:hypothetical protein n=1 Tax=Streptomyces sp. NPDC089919 TaxID=3155188 RepID=UPI00343297D9